MTERVGPHEPAKYEDIDIIAVSAVARGEADPEQQQRAGQQRAAAAALRDGSRAMVRGCGRSSPAGHRDQNVRRRQ